MESFRASGRSGQNREETLSPCSPAQARPFLWPNRQGPPTNDLPFAKLLPDIGGLVERLRWASDVRLALGGPRDEFRQVTHAQEAPSRQRKQRGRRQGTVGNSAKWPQPFFRVSLPAQATPQSNAGGPAETMRRRSGGGADDRREGRRRGRPTESAAETGRPPPAPVAQIHHSRGGGRGQKKGCAGPGRRGNYSATLAPKPFRLSATHSAADPPSPSAEPNPTIGRRGGRASVKRLRPLPVSHRLHYSGTRPEQRRCGPPSGRSRPPQSACLLGPPPMEVRPESRRGVSRG